MVSWCTWKPRTVEGLYFPPDFERLHTSCPELGELGSSSWNWELFDSVPERTSAMFLFNLDCLLFVCRTVYNVTKYMIIIVWNKFFSFSRHIRTKIRSAKSEFLRSRRNCEDRYGKRSFMYLIQYLGNLNVLADFVNEGASPPRDFQIIERLISAFERISGWPLPYDSRRPPYYGVDSASVLPYGLTGLQPRPAKFAAPK